MKPKRKSTLFDDDDPMKTIVLISGLKNLKRHLSKHKKLNEKLDFYICLSDAPAGLFSLEERGFEKVAIHSTLKNNQNIFLREYVDFVGNLNEKLNSDLWWCTDISSRNRFRSSLSKSFQQIAEVLAFVQNADFQTLLIIDADIAVQFVLQTELAKIKICCVTIGGQFSRQMASWTKRIKRTFSIVYHFTRFVMRTLICRALLRSKLNEKMNSRQSYYVVKTFIYDNSFTSNGYTDSFFCSLIPFLSKNVRLVVFADILGNYVKCLQKSRQQNDFIIMAIEYGLSLTDLLECLIGIFTARFQIEGKLDFFGYDVSRIVKHDLSVHLNGISFYQYIHYWCVKKLSQKINIQTFLLTYENNPWERMSVRAIRKFSPNTRIIAYQHNVIPHASANLFISQTELKTVPLPDLILTTGLRPKQILEKYGSYPDGLIQPACALRLEHLLKNGRRPRRRYRPNILVTLEGIYEVYKLVNYVIKEIADRLPYQIRIRPHPVLSMNKIKSELIRDIDSIRNFHVSQQASLQEDIEWSAVVVYWGSTVSMEALMMGKPLIHFNNQSILNYDPLFECSHLKWIVSEQDSLETILREINSIEDQEFERQFNDANTYLKQYFFPVSDENYQGFISQNTHFANREQSSDANTVR